MPRERINGPGERYGTMRSYIKAGVGFDVAAEIARIRAEGEL